jgi:hypothetical protein
MALPIESRVVRLGNRRSDPAIPGFLTESYAKRALSAAAKYVLGAMQEVNPRSTEISLEEAEKVEKNLTEGLKDVSLFPDFRLQGSVAANTHIRSVSDVDLLCIHGVWVSAAPCPQSKKTYSEYYGRGDLVDDVLHLREEAIKVLKRRFWGATVETYHEKSIALHGGAFRRKVDVVPSHWYDPAKYQITLDETYRGVDIVNKTTREKTRNFPFLYVHELNRADATTNGATKMAIRLAKNVKNDSSDDIELSSYDIGSLFYHCSPQQLFYRPQEDLAVLVDAESWLSYLSANPSFAMGLDTPDSTRKILDSSTKVKSLGILARELRELSSELAGELLKFGGSQPNVEFSALRKALRETPIPLV